jgi:hypothetical protein
MKLKQFVKPTKSQIENYVSPDRDKPYLETLEITSEYSKTWLETKEKVQYLFQKAHDLIFYCDWAEKTPEERLLDRTPMSADRIKYYRSNYPEETTAIDAGRGQNLDYYFGERKAFQFILTAMGLEFFEEQDPDPEDQELFLSPDGKIGHFFGGLEEALEELAGPF